MRVLQSFRRVAAFAVVAVKCDRGWLESPVVSVLANYDNHYVWRHIYVCLVHVADARDISRHSDAIQFTWGLCTISSANLASRPSIELV